MLNSLDNRGVGVHGKIEQESVRKDTCAHGASEEPIFLTNGMCAICDGIDVVHIGGEVLNAPEWRKVVVDTLCNVRFI